MSLRLRMATPIPARLVLPGSLALVCALSGCSTIAGPASAPAGAPARDAAFACDLYDQLAKQPGNILFSPAALASGLALIGTGAHGGSAGEIADVLHVAPDTFATWRFEDADPPAVNVALSLWTSARAEIVPAFLDAARTRAAAGVETVDFTTPDVTRTRINAAVSTQTVGDIPALLDGPPDPQTALLLTAVLTFHGQWATPFRPGLTRQGDFNSPSGVIPMPIMNLESVLRYAETATAQVVELPYAGDDAMDVIVPFSPNGGLLGYINPPEGTPADPMQELAATEAELHRSGFAVFAGLANHYVGIHLPRMTIACHPDLRQPLHALGLDAVFDAQRADLSGIAAGHLWLGAIHHRATLTCDELGTTASAATGMEVPPASAPDADINATHPFILIVRNLRSGNILFIARVVDPSQGNP